MRSGEREKIAGFISIFSWRGNSIQFSKHLFYAYCLLDSAWLWRYWHIAINGHQLFSSLHLCHWIVPSHMDSGLAHVIYFGWWVCSKRDASWNPENFCHWGLPTFEALGTLPLLPGEEVQASLLGDERPTAQRLLWPRLPKQRGLADQQITYVAQLSTAEDQHKRSPVHIPTQNCEWKWLL